MISTLFSWTKTVAAAVLILNSLLYTQAFYDASARRLEITPKDCTSLKYPNTIGTCMFNLKCKEKLGVVIGACVDRFLFGACCHFPQGETTSGTGNNVGPPAPGIPSSTPKLGTDLWGQTTGILIPPTTIESIPLSPPTRYPSEYGGPPPRFPQATDSLQSSNAPIKFGDSTTMSPSPDYTTLLPVPLEIVPDFSDSYAHRHRPTHSNLHHQHSGLFVPLEYSTLKSAHHVNREETTTEEPPRFSTFMYVDGILSEGSTNPPELSTNPSSFPVNNERVTTLEPPALSDSGTETLWSIVHQLVPSHPKHPPPSHVPLNSDELYNVLSASEPVGSIMENRIQVIPPLNHGIWKVTTTSSVSETVRPITPPPPRPTNRPWASSTYEIHTFRYPDMGVTNPFPGGGLVTWSGILEDRIPIPEKSTQMPSTQIIQKLTTTTLPPVTTRPSPKTIPPPVATTGTFFVRTTTKPVAEVTKPPPVTTTPSPRTTSTTEKPTTTSTSTTTTLPPRKRTTPKEVVTKTTTVKPKVTYPPSKPPVAQPGILQSDFDSNIDDFVNQVVQNLAGSLDNLDLDEVILHSPSPSSITKEDSPPTLHPLHVLSDPLFPPFPVVGQVPLIKPAKPPVKKVTPPTTTSRPLDYRRDCGVRSLTKQGRIVGGTPAKFGKWPWQALVREATWLGLFSKNKCGGVLISPKYVLTAAHCQPGFLATLTVVLGDFDISSETEGTGKNPNSITKNVRRVIVHRDYNAMTFENDIALLELETVVEYQQHIVPICLPMDNEVHVGQQAFVTGWGRLKYGGGVPNMLYEVDVPILNNTDCQNMFLKSGHIKAIRESFICAGYANGAKDSCEGDSGGPLAMMRENGQWMLAGTVSHGIKCAYPNLPGVYMRMTYYKPWIKRVTGITNAD